MAPGCCCLPRQARVAAEPKTRPGWVADKKKKDIDGSEGADGTDSAKDHGEEARKPERVTLGARPLEDRARQRTKRPLISAAKRGDVAAVRAALAERPSSLDEPAMWGNSALICACLNGHGEVALALLAAGADPCVANDHGCTALHHACIEGMETVVRAMVPRLQKRPAEAQARVHASVTLYNPATDCSTEQSPLEAACSNDHAGLARLLLMDRFFVDARPRGAAAVLLGLRAAIAAGASRSAEAVIALERPAAGEALAKDVALLVSAVRSRKAGLVRLLLDANAKVDGCSCGQADSAQEGSPLAMACRLADADIAMDLLHAGADPNFTCGRCSLPLMEACRAGDVDTVQELRSAGAHVKLRDPRSGMSPVDFAANAGADDLMGALSAEPYS